MIQALRIRKIECREKIKKKNKEDRGFLIIFFIIVAFFIGTMLGASVMIVWVHSDAKKAGVGEWYIDNDDAKAWQWLPAAKEKK